jgi:hypothetical protein
MPGMPGIMRLHRRWKMTFVIGDKVKSKFATPDSKPGVIELLIVPGMRDCALVRYPGSMDGMCVPRKNLVKVD